MHSFLNNTNPGEQVLNIVSDLWLANTKTWNQNKITHFFGEQAAQIITQVQVSDLEEPDILCWKPSASGICTAKEAYKYLEQENLQPIPTQGTRALPQSILILLNKIWNHKLIQPRIKTFAWRLLRQAIAQERELVQIQQAGQEEHQERHLQREGQLRATCAQNTPRSLQPGPRCYTDAVIALDNLATEQSKAGVGVFVRNTSATTTSSGIFIFAQVTYISDNQLLVTTLQKKDIITAPGHWNLRPHLAAFMKNNNETQFRYGNLS
ncbi:uncharacterized protein LOC133904549 [Phragmites australis]|uniref:uncharacterized protein LOC133904549 n=1 Tax=Phragmites australis TaxID=29695 RepID=UPI002D792B70|nr:uncharacterized protein LOC133904549 [Phragmites australis]